MPKKPFNTQINADIIKQFSEKCRAKGEKVTEVTEALLYLYANDKIELEKKTVYGIKSK